MAVPAYRCPFKINQASNEGIPCENTNCGAYDGDAEHCAIVEFVQRQLVINGKSEPNND